jgi:voltage-gated potassium channel
MITAGSRIADPWRRPRWAVLAVVALLVAGTVGYSALTGASAIDALYMTVITVSTVGYAEKVPVDTPAAKGFTIVLILSALVVIAYTVSGLAEVVFTDVALDTLGRRRMGSRIAAARDQVIVCGYGRMGRGVVEELAAEGRQVVVVTMDEADETAIREEGGLCVVGDATRDETLQVAGIDRASALMAVTDSDAVNVMVTLSARALNPELRIAARAGYPETEAKLRRAGADYVLRHHSAGAMHMALAVTNPAVEDVLSRLIPRRGGLDMGQLAIAASSPMVGRTLLDLRGRVHSGLVLAILRGDEILLPPDPTEPLRPEDVLVVVGSPGALGEMRHLLAS